MSPANEPPSLPGGDPPPTDDRLMAAVCNGDQGAFSCVYDRYAPSVYGLALTILGSVADAESVVSDVFLEVWRKPHVFDHTRGSCRTYLLTLTRSRAIDRARADTVRKKRTSSAQQERAGERERKEQELEPSALAETGERRDAVLRALDRLDPDDRATLRLAYFEGLTHQQIAEQTDTPLGTVKTRIRRAMKQLRQNLKPLGDRDALP